MRKSIVTAVVLILCVSVLAGCGGGGSDTPTSQTPTTQSPPTTTPEQTTTPTTTTPEETPTTPTTPEPAGDPMITVTVSHDTFGGMSLSFPEDKGYEVVESAGNLDITAFTEVSEFRDYIQDHLKAHIVGDGFEVAMGFKDRSDTTPRTYQSFFDAEKERGYDRNQFTEIQFGNEDGFVVNRRGIACFVFPGMTETSIRTIAIFTDETKEKGSSIDTETIPSILGNPDIEALLDSLVFIGDSPGGATTDEPGDTTLTAETVEGGYITFTAEDGWHVVDSDGLANEKTYRIQYQDSVFTQIRIRLDKFNTLLELTDGVVSSVSAERLDDITIGGIRYHVLQQSGGSLWLTTSAGTFDDDKKGAIVISLGNTSLETAMPFLETISVHELS